MRHRRRATAATLAAVLALAGCEPDEPTTSPQEPEDTETPPAEGDRDAEPDDEVVATFEEIVEQVAELRELSPEEELPVEVVTSEELVEVAMDVAEEELERLEQLQRILVALHHLPEDADLVELQSDLVEAGAAGLYDHDRGVSFVVGDEGELSPMQQTVVAHEAVHALQDQRFDLGRVEELDEDPDATTAFMAVVEGDAVRLQEQWARTHLTEEEQQQRQQEELAEAQRQLGDLQELPPALVHSFLAPYVIGPPFVEALASEGGNDALDAALKDPPRTTVEVLDPQLYREGFTPTEVDAGTAPDGWDELERLPSGAFDVMLLLELAEGHRASAGLAPAAWRGGQLAAWEREDEVAVATAWVFQDQQAADAACEVVPDWYATVADGEPTGEAGVHQGPRDTLVVDCEAETVRFALAPDAEVARDLLPS